MPNSNKYRVLMNMGQANEFIKDTLQIEIDSVEVCRRDAKDVCIEQASAKATPLGAGLQEQASNYHKLLWSRVKVVSVMEKAQLCVMYEIGRRMKMNH